MKIKNLMIIAAIAILILSSVALLFFRELANQSASAPVQSPSMKTLEEAPKPVYSIPVNTVPNVAEIEANIKKTQDARAEINKISAQVAAEDAVRRQEIRQQLEAAVAAPEETAVTATVQKNASTSQRVVVNNPTREERKAMQVRGVVAY